MKLSWNNGWSCPRHTIMNMGIVPCDPDASHLNSSSRLWERQNRQMFRTGKSLSRKKTGIAPSGGNTGRQWITRQEATGDGERICAAREAAHTEAPGSPARFIPSLAATTVAARCSSWDTLFHLIEETWCHLRWAEMKDICTFFCSHLQ